MKFYILILVVIVIIGLIGSIPVWHFIFLIKTKSDIDIGVEWLMVTVILGLTSAAVYLSQYPERLSPGTFDIWVLSRDIIRK
jgi:hypothetical protein